MAGREEEGLPWRLRFEQLMVENDRLRSRLAEYEYDIGSLLRQAQDSLNELSHSLETLNNVELETAARILRPTDSNICRRQRAFVNDDDGEF